MNMPIRNVPLWKHTLDYVVWNDARLSIPKENGEYLCKLALLKHCDCTEVDAEPIVYSYVYDVIYYDKNNGFNDYDDTEIVAWMPIPKCDIN